MEKMNQENFSNTIDFSLTGIDTSHYVNFIKFLDENKKENDALVCLRNLRKQRKAELLKADTTSLKVIARLCNKYACLLLTKKQGNKEAQALLEFAKSLIEPLGDQLDTEYQRIKDAISNNLAIYSLSTKDKTAYDKFIKAALENERALKTYQRALIYQNLGVGYMRQRMYENSIQSCQKALVLLESDVLNVIKTTDNSQALRENKDLIQKATIMLNAYLTLAVVLEKVKNNPIQKDLVIQKFSPSLLQKPFLKNGYKLSKSLLGASHSFTLKFKNKLELSTKREEVLESVQHKVKPEWLQKSGLLDRSSSHARLLEIPRRSSRTPDIFTVDFKNYSNENKHSYHQPEAIVEPLKLEPNARERLALLLDNKAKGDLTKKSDGHPLNSTFSSTSSSKGFRIKHNSFSNLPKQPINFHLEPAVKNGDNDFEAHQQPVPIEETKNIISRQGSRKEVTRPPRRLSKSIMHLKAVEKEVENLTQSQLGITKNIESILKHQIELENKVSRKIEEAILQSQNVEVASQTLAQKEFELQIETLKKENEKIQKTKLDKELEIEQLRLQLSITQNNLTKMSSPTGSPYGNAGVFFPYGPYAGIPLPHTLSPMGMPNFPSHQLPQNYNMNTSQMPSPDFRSQNGVDSPSHGNANQNPQMRGLPTIYLPQNREKRPSNGNSIAEINEANQIRNKPTSYELSAKNIETLEVQNALNKDSNNTDAKEPKNTTSVKIEPPEIRVLPTEKQSDEKHKIYNAAEAKSITNDKSDSEKLPGTTITLNSKGISTLNLKGPSNLDFKILSSNSNEEQKSNRSNATSSIIKSSRRQGKYSNPDSRRFNLDFSELNKKSSESIVALRPKAEEKVVAPKDSKTQIDQKTNPTLPKPVAVVNKQESVTSINLVQNKEQSQPIEAAVSINKQPPLIHKFATANDVKFDQHNNRSLGSISTANTNSKNQAKNLKIEEFDGHETILNTLGSAQQIQILGINENYESKFDPSPKVNLARAQEPTQLAWLLETPDYIKLPKKASIKKQFTLPDDINLYIIDCVLENNGGEPLIKLILSQKPLTHDDCWVLFEEKYTLSQIKKILSELEYRDVLPSNLTVRSIRTYESLVKHCIFPFIGISEDKQSYKKLDLWAKAPSFAKALREVQFYNHQCFLSLHHVSHTDFRIVVTHNETGETFRVDLALDDPSFESYFTWIKPFKQIDNPIEDLLSVIDILEDDEATATEFATVTKIRKKYENQERVEIELESCKPKDIEKEKMLLEFIKQILGEIEGVLQAKGLNDFFKLCDLSSKFKYFKLRIFNSFKQTNFSVLLENVEKNGIDVYLKDFYETHAPQKKKVKAEGKFFYPMERVWKDFALDYNKMEQDDKNSIYCLISELFMLNTHDKPLGEQENLIYEENPMVHLPIDCGTFSRSFKGQNYKYPVTSVLVGVNGYAFGVKTYIYDLEKCKEKGVFFYLNPHSWKKKENAEEKKPRRKVVTITLPMKEKYNFENVLTRKGFEIIERNLVYDQTPNRVDLLGVNSLRNAAQTELLENIINVQNFVKYYRETKDLDLEDD